MIRSSRFSTSLRNCRRLPQLPTKGSTSRSRLSSRKRWQSKPWPKKSWTKAIRSSACTPSKTSSTTTRAMFDRMRSSPPILGIRHPTYPTASTRHLSWISRLCKSKQRNCLPWPDRLRILRPAIAPTSAFSYLATSTSSRTPR